jgi:acyl-CoA reductase-like NAD-dependent aldehyde dehydrogenase
MIAANKGAESEASLVHILEIERRLQLARKGQGEWRATPLRERLKVVRRLRTAIARQPLEWARTVNLPQRWRPK